MCHHMLGYQERLQLLSCKEQFKYVKENILRCTYYGLIFMQICISCLVLCDILQHCLYLTCKNGVLTIQIQ